MPPVDAPTMLGDGVLGNLDAHNNMYDDNDDGDHVTSFAWSKDAKRPRGSSTKKEEEEPRLKKTRDEAATAGDEAGASPSKRNRAKFPSDLPDEAEEKKRARISLGSTSSESTGTTSATPTNTTPATSTTPVTSATPAPDSNKMESPFKYYQTLPTPFHGKTQRRYSDSHTPVGATAVTPTAKPLVLPSRDDLHKKGLSTPTSPHEMALAVPSKTGPGISTALVVEEAEDDDDDDDEHFVLVDRLRRWGTALWSGVDSAYSAVNQFRRRLFFGMLALRLGFLLLLVPSVAGLALLLALSTLFTALRILTLGQVDAFVDGSRLGMGVTRALVGLTLCCLCGLLSPAFAVFGLLAALSQSAVEVAEPLLEMRYRAHWRKLQHLYSLVTDPLLLESVGTVLHATQVAVQAGAQATEAAWESGRATTHKAFGMAEDTLQHAATRAIGHGKASRSLVTQDAAPRAVVPQDFAPRAVVPRDSAPPRSVPQDCAPPRSVAQDSAPRSVPQDTAPPRSVPRDTAPPSVKASAPASTTPPAPTADTPRAITEATPVSTRPTVTATASVPAAAVTTKLPSPVKAKVAPRQAVERGVPEKATTAGSVLEFSKESTQALVLHLWKMAGRWVSPWAAILQRRLPKAAYEWLVEQVAQIRESGLLEVAAVRLLQFLHSSEHFMGGAQHLLPYVQAVQQVRRDEASKRRAEKQFLQKQV